MLMDFLRRLHDPKSEERLLYRERKAAGACRLCGCVDPGNAFCADCYSALKEAREDAKAQGICSTCFSAPIAPSTSRRYRGPLTQCAACREAEAIRHTERKLRRSMGIEDQEAS